MTRYDKVWVPVGDEGVNSRTKINTNVGMLDEKESVILCSIEELREMWRTAQGWGDEVKDFNDSSHTFETFLKSKGINI